MNQNEKADSGAAATKGAMMEVTIDGQKSTVDEATTIFEAARRMGIDIPALCHRPDLDLDPVAVCRVCMVDVGEKNYAAACMRPCGTLRDEKSGKIKSVTTKSAEVDATRKTLVELLLAEHPRPCTRHQQTHDCELELLGEKYGLIQPLPRKPAAEVLVVTALDSIFPQRAARKSDKSNFSIAVDHSACIVCDRCARACGDVAGHNIIGRLGKGANASIGFDNDQSMGDSGCVNCGWCMVACPTGALVYTGEERTNRFPDPLSLEDMQQLPFIKAARVSPAFLKRYYGGVRVRMFEKGEVIVHQNDHGHTAFYIDSGKVDVYLEKSSRVAVSTGFIDRLKSFFGRTDCAIEPAGPARNGVISADAGVDLPVDTLIASMPEGDSLASRLFGEASCRNGQPRTATVRAAVDNTVVIEMQRDVLDVLLRSPGFREDFERSDRLRLIHNYLRSSKVFAGVPSKDLDSLESKATLVKCTEGQVIFNQGDPSDAFYMVRIGHVKVERGGVVMNYLTRGQYFGEIALLRGAPRSMNCIAADNAELLRIDKFDFEELLAKYPSVREEIERKATQREGADRFRATAGADGAHSAELHQYMEQELFEGQSLLILDLDRCTRCDECVRACAQSHNGVPRMIRDGLRFQNYLIPTACRSCHDPKCLSGCPVDAIHRTEGGGLAIVIEDHCTGCGFCFGQDAEGEPTGTGCPYGNIFPVPAMEVNRATGEEKLWRKAAMCDLDHCKEEGEEPSCVYACPHQAAQRVNAHEFFGRKLLSEVGVSDITK